MEVSGGREGLDSADQRGVTPLKKQKAKLGFRTSLETCSLKPFWNSIKASLQVQPVTVSGKTSLSRLPPPRVKKKQQLFIDLQSVSDSLVSTR